MFILMVALTKKNAEVLKKNIFSKGDLVVLTIMRFKTNFL